MAKETSTTPGKFMMLGSSKFVHVVRTKALDLKKTGGSNCQQVRKFQVAGKVPKGKGMSVEAASVLEPCQHCDTTAEINAMTSPADKRAKSKATTKDTLDKRREEAKPAKKGKATKSKAEPKQDGPRKMTKTGPLSVGDERTKAQDLVEFGEQYGYKGKVMDREDGIGLMAVMTKGDETIRCFFADGKYDHARHAEIVVGDWTGKLRAVHACRRQMSMEGRDRPYPNPGAGRSGPRTKAVEEVPEDESPEDALKRVPFLIDDEPQVIIDAIKGMNIRWRNGQAAIVEEATLPSESKGKKRDKITITAHPKTERRMVNFLTVDSVNEHGEVYGPERSVYLDKIIRVVG